MRSDDQTPLAPWNEQIAAVLGATGMIGRHVAGVLLQRGAKVRALVRQSSPALNLHGLPIERVTGDLSDPHSLDALLAGADLLFHCAAPYPRTHFQRERQVREAAAGMETVLAAARRHLPAEGGGARGGRLNRIVYVSSSTTIGRPGRAESGDRRLANEDDRESPPRGSSPYFAMKEAMEEVAMREAARGLPIVIGNPTLCVDTHDSTPTTGKLLLSVAKRLPFYFPGDINVVATRDVAEALVNATAHGRAGERCILGGENMTARSFLELVAEAVGVPPPRIAFPLDLAEGLAHATELANLALRRRWPLLPVSGVQMLRYSQFFDCSRARTELRMPQTPVTEAVRDAFAWFRENGYL